MKKKKKIYLATWREGQNFGDDYISFSLKTYLTEELSDIKIIETNLHLDNYKLNKEDVLMIGGGGLWGPSGTGKLEDKLYSKWVNTKAQLIIANIGIESFCQESKNQLFGLENKSLLFSFRDKQSYLIAGSYLQNSKIFWGADTTYLRPININRSIVKNYIGVNICGPEVENYTYKFSPEYIVDCISKLSNDIRAVCFSNKNSVLDYKYNQLIDPKVKKYFTVNPYQHCEIFIGMRFHSILLALQNCIPVIAISYSDKVKRTMEEYELIDYCFKPNDDNLLKKLCNAQNNLKNNREIIIEKIKKGNCDANERLMKFKDELMTILQNWGDRK